MRHGARVGLAAIALYAAYAALEPAVAESDTRTLSFLHLHTRETLTVTFKRNGRFDDDALRKLNHFLRDWRRDEETRMDPKLFDILWEVYRDVGGRQPIEIVSAYRSPNTNNMLRARSSGVAENSNHTHGQAIDFEIPGVPLDKIREIGLRLQRGGVGFYPTSGSPFVHLDTGTIRHWPRMTRDQLVKVFPDQRTVHIPSDGQPLAGYSLALADVQRRGNAPSSVLMAQARQAGFGGGEAEIAEASDTDETPKPRNLLAALFGGRKSEKADTPAKPAKPAVVLASAAPNVKPTPVETARIVPLPAARPQIAGTAPIALADAGNVIAPRSGVWSNAVDSGQVAPAQSPFTFADTMGASSEALAYAVEPPRTTASISQSSPPPSSRAQPMGGVQMPPALPAALLAARMNASASAVMPEIAGGGQRTDSPWLRAMVLSPDLSRFMTASFMGTPDMRPIAQHFAKPAQVVLMGFSADPGLGIVAHRFTGNAVTFLATATFVKQATASLR